MRHTERREPGKVIGLAFIVVLSGARCGSDGVVPERLVAGSEAQSVFAEDFESGTLVAWQDGVDPLRHRIVRDPVSARSGSHYLQVTCPAGGDGGWITRLLARGYDSLYVSYYVRFPSSWRGGSKLVAFYGSREDQRWSAFGKAGVCPDGRDFFAAMLSTEPSGDPGPVRFYTYHAGMAREPDGVTCWGRLGDDSTKYTPPLRLIRDSWHRVEFCVQLNTPGRDDGGQRFWLDGVERGTWPGLRFRESAILSLNAVQLTFSVTGGVPRTQHLAVDDLVVSAKCP